MKFNSDSDSTITRKVNHLFLKTSWTWVKESVYVHTIYIFSTWFTPRRIFAGTKWLGRYQVHSDFCMPSILVYIEFFFIMTVLYRDSRIHPLKNNYSIKNTRINVFVLRANSSWVLGELSTETVYMYICMLMKHCQFQWVLLSPSSCQTISSDT